MSTAVAPTARPSPHTSLLAATALGFAYVLTTSDETYVRRLASLAEAQPETLEQARIAVLTAEIASVGTRRQAARLLSRAADDVRRAR